MITRRGLVRKNSIAKILGVLGTVVVSLGWTIDPDPNMIGVYFDTNSQINLMSTGGLSTFNVYISVTNVEATGFHGLEVGYKIEAIAGSLDALQRISSTLPPGSVDLGDSSNPWEGDYVVGLASPLPVVESVPFVTWQFLLISSECIIGFAIGPARTQTIDDGWPAGEIGGVVIPLFIVPSTACMPEGPCFETGNNSAILFSYAVPTDRMSFGSVKGLYR